jgi:hypothetical protein
VRAPAVLALAVATGASGAASAEPIDLDLPTARHVARAGAALVSDDGAGALLANPASLARQEATRAELGIALRDADGSFRASPAASDAPTIEDRGAPRVVPAAFAAAAVGGVVLAAGYVESADARAELPAPEPGQPPGDVARLFPHRYGGTGSGVRCRTLLFGAGARLGEWLGVGAALHASDAEVSEARAVWAGFAGRDIVGDPTRDLALTMSAHDRLVLGGALGVLIAPPDAPFEIAFGVRARGRVAGQGDADLTATHGASRPAPELDQPRSEIELQGRVVLAAGARYLGERVTVELGGELAEPTGDAPRWRLEGVSVRDDTGALGRLDEVPALAIERRRIAGRIAVDVAAIEDFLWLTAGYGLARAARAPSRLAPAAIDLAGHTLAIGAEASWDDVSLALGYARVFSRSRAVDAATTDVALINPFGQGAGTAPAAAGRYDQAADSIALDLRVTWP